MTIDHENNKNKKKIIELLIISEKSGVWIPAMVTQIYIVDKNGDIAKIQEIRVRNLNEK